MTYHFSTTRLASAIGATIFALMGCSQAPQNNTSVAQSDLPSVQYDMPAAQAPGSSVAQRRVAVTHNFSLSMPVAGVEVAQRKHLDECRKIGCTILSTQLNRWNDGRITARSSLRIPPEAYANFATALTAPPMNVVGHSETAEDKFVPILDLEKRLEMKSALRQRLTALLQDSNTKSVADIIAVEKELAQVQGDIETATAQHNYLLTITNTLRVDISYSGQAAVVGGFDFSPVTRAINGLGVTFATSVAALIMFLAMALPWLPLIGLVVWAVRRGIRRWKKPKLA